MLARIESNDLEQFNESINKIAHTFSQKAWQDLQDLRKKLNGIDLEDQLLAYKIIRQISQHPPELDDQAYKLLVNSLNEKKEVNFIKKILTWSADEIIRSLNKFLLEVLGVGEQQELYVKKFKELQSLIRQENDPYYRCYGLMLDRINEVIAKRNPDIISPSAAEEYLAFLKAGVIYFDKIKSSIQNPIASALREDDISLPHFLHEENSYGVNLYGLDAYIANIKAERIALAKHIYPNLDTFLQLKSELREFAQNKLLDLWKACQVFCGAPTLQHLQELETHINAEKNLANFINKKILSKFLEQAQEIAYYDIHYEFKSVISVPGTSPLIYDTGKICLNEIDRVKKSGQETTRSLTDKLTTMTNAVKSPHLHNQELIVKSHEVAKSGLKMLGGAMLCLVGATLMAGAIYFTAQTVAGAWPITTAISKAVVELITFGTGMMFLNGIVLGKSISFFVDSFKQPALSKAIVGLHDAIDIVSKKRYPR